MEEINNEQLEVETQKRKIPITIAPKIIKQVETHKTHAGLLC